MVQPTPTSVIVHLRRDQLPLLEPNLSKKTLNEALNTRFRQFPHKTLLGSNLVAKSSRHQLAMIASRNGMAKWRMMMLEAMLRRDSFTNPGAMDYKPTP